MTQEEMKQNILDWATDVSIAAESFSRNIKFKMKKATVEADLQEAKSSAKKLFEKIDEYLETLKPEFKVGGYVTLDIPNNKKIAKIDRLNGDTLHGLWYDTESKNIEQYFYFGSGIAVRRATLEEIAEYEVALTFHKHGRKPFEVRKGDILRDDKGNIFFVDYPTIWEKEYFTIGDYTFVKTAEEVNEWLENK